MAPSLSDNTPDFTDRPLADYFWIAGVDGQDLLDAYRPDVEDHHAVQTLDSPVGRAAVEETIEEDAAAEEEEEDQDQDHAPSFVDSPTVSTRQSRRDSYQKLARISSEAHSSIHSGDKLTQLSSVRSSATIRRVISSSRHSFAPSSPSQRNFNTDVRMSAVLSDADFEKVLKRFTNDRDAFFLDLTLKDDAAPTKQSKPTPKPRPRTQRIVAEDLEPGPSPNRTLGSVRRHMSFKDMNSHKRAPSMARRFSTRSARRMSSYNSVMPMPQPHRSSPGEHPLKRSFEPVLLDRYPRSEMGEELLRREQFPDYVPMFAFPNDVHIISSDSRPATKWHEFFLTSSDNSKRPAVCVITWIPLDRRIADQLEKKCEEWRRAHMSEAERELAASLGERLAAERAKLSRLLAKLPSIESGTDTREDLEDEIGDVEEKIAVMSDMLKPLRHGAANKIEGLTDGDSGLWIPRAYGIMGRDQSMASFWKEWLKAVVVPMMDGGVLRVPPSSPRVGMWQPLERYVHTLCTQALQPMSSKVQVEVTIRELRLYAKKEARNELPGSRTTDLYPLFRCLTVPNIVILFEYLLSESRIILVSAYTSLLKLASNALMALLWPMEWSGVHIPVLPTRLMEVLEAPIPYICGVVRKNDNLSLPQDDDFLMVDLDKNELHATAHPHPLPKQQRKKLLSMLYLAAPHHQTRGVSTGPPAYVFEAFPHEMFMSENPTVFSPITTSIELAKLASMSSARFGPYAVTTNLNRSPVFNAFAQAKPPSSVVVERPQTSSTARRPSHTDGSDQVSPVTATFPPLPTTPQSRNDSGFALQASLKEKRSAHFDVRSRHSPSMPNIRRKASLPFIRHNASLSAASEVPTFTGSSTYASSTYAQSTLAASTIMPGMPYQQVQNSSTVQWHEGHCMQWRAATAGTTCAICSEKSEDGHFQCTDCPAQTHARCVMQICLPCPSAFHPDQIRVAFARFFASLFYNYRRFLRPANAVQRQLGLQHKFDADAWIRSLPPDHAEYMKILKDTQAFDGFVQERETQGIALTDSVALFDAIMAAKKIRTKGVRSSLAVSLSGRNPFAGHPHTGGVPAEYLSDTSTHAWRLVITPHSAERADLGSGAKGREYRKVISRTPAKLEDELFVPPPMPKPKQVPQVNGKKSLKLQLKGLSTFAT